MHDVAYARDKTCPRCKTTKPLDDFPKDASRKDGRMSRCRACDNARSSTYYYSGTSKRRAEKQPHRHCTYCAKPTDGLRFCDDLCKEQHAWERRSSPIAISECNGCGKPFAHIRGHAGRKHCSKDCWLKHSQKKARLRYDPAKERAKRDKRMRAINLEHTDITAAHIAKLYRQTKACPLCDVRLIATPTQPNSREVDHIIPINVGGTHTIGNVRVICRACNLSRPDDGSDIDAHQPTLWATDLQAARVIALARHATTSSKPLPPAFVRERKQAAFALRDFYALILRNSGMSWAEVAARCGYTAESSATTAVSNRFPGMARRFRVPSKSRDITSTHEHWRRVALMLDAGSTWGQVADTFGYANGRSASRCMRSYQRRLADSGSGARKIAA